MEHNDFKLAYNILYFLEKYAESQLFTKLLQDEKCHSENNNVVYFFTLKQLKCEMNIQGEKKCK